MSVVKKDAAKVEDGSAVSRIRITLSSRNAKALEKVCSDLLGRAKDEKITTRGPVRLPTRTLVLVTRKSPCGNGTNTWDRFEMKIFKRLVDLVASKDAVKKITGIQMEAGVDVEIDVMDK